MHLLVTVSIPAHQPPQSLPFAQPKILLLLGRKTGGGESPLECIFGGGKGRGFRFGILKGTFFLQQKAQGGGPGRGWHSPNVRDRVHPSLSFAV